MSTIKIINKMRMQTPDTGKALTNGEVYTTDPVHLGEGSSEWEEVDISEIPNSTLNEKTDPDTPDLRRLL